MRASKWPVATADWAGREEDDDDDDDEREMTGMQSPSTRDSRPLVDESRACGRSHLDQVQFASICPQLGVPQACLAHVTCGSSSQKKVAGSASSPSWIFRIFVVSVFDFDLRILKPDFSLPFCAPQYRPLLTSPSSPHEALAVPSRRRRAPGGAGLLCCGTARFDPRDGGRADEDETTDRRKRS